MELKLIFLVITAVVSVVYLFLLVLKKEKIHSVLKCCLMPLILAVYIVGADRILLPIVLALIFGWAGDVLLLKITDLRCFRLGLASFLAGHICYIAAMYNFARPFNFTVLVISIVITISLGFLIFRIIRPNKEMKIPVIAYEAIIMTMALFALQVFLVQGGSFGALVLTGSLCFVISDSILAYDTFQKKTTLGYFLVMFTYIAAQLLITLGFCSPGI